MSVIIALVSTLLSLYINLKPNPSTPPSITLVLMLPSPYSNACPNPTAILILALTLPPPYPNPCPQLNFTIP